MTRPLAFAALLFSVIARPAGAQDPAVALKMLQGRWIITSAQQQGKAIQALRGGVMLISGPTFEIRPAVGMPVQGTLTVDPTKRPFQIDLTHGGGAWEGIYEASVTGLRLAYVDAALEEERPASFTPSAKSEVASLTLRRESR